MLSLVPRSNMLSVIIAIFVTFLSFLYWFQRDSRLPPGPKGIPIVGTLPFLTNFPPKKFQKWGMEYDGIYTWRCGRADVVVLTDYDLAYELLVKQGEKIITRPPLRIFDLTSQGYGLIFANESIWGPQRIFVANVMRRLVAGKTLVENNIKEEAKYMVNVIHETSGELVDPKEFFWASTINVSMAFITSRRFRYNDKELHAIGTALARGIQENGDTMILLYNFPFLRHIPVFGKVEKNFVNDCNVLFDIFKKYFREHEKTFDQNHIRDFMDAFIVEMRKDGHNKGFNENQICVLAKDLLDGGAHTTTSTLQWLMIALLKYPEYQKNLREEIDAVIGENVDVTARHREQMPQTIAFITEVMRRCTIVSGTQVSVTTEVKVGGYTIPKATPITTAIWSIHNDPKYFENPTEFLPKRFIDPDTGKFVKSRYFIPFSIGRRNCVGDSLAQLETFVFLVSILQHFELQADDLSAIPGFDDGKCGVVYVPRRFKMRFVERS